MPAVFINPPGATVLLPPLGGASPNASPALVNFGGDARQTPVASAVITSVTVSEQVSFQTRLSLARTLYVYTFGDQPTEMSVSFTLLTKDCEGNLTPAIESFNNFYKRIRLRTTKAEPIDLTISGVTYRAYCVGMTLRLQQASFQTVATGTLQLLGFNTSLNDA